MQTPRYIVNTTVDVVPEHEDEFNRWYNEKHIPEVLACPGWVSAARFVSVDEFQPRHLALFEVESKDALWTPEMAKVYGWGEMSPHIRSFSGRVYEKSFEAFRD